MKDNHWFLFIPVQTCPSEEITTSVLYPKKIVLFLLLLKTHYSDGPKKRSFISKQQLWKLSPKNNFFLPQMSLPIQPNNLDHVCSNSTLSYTFVSKLFLNKRTEVSNATLFNFNCSKNGLEPWLFVAVYSYIMSFSKVSKSKMVQKTTQEFLLGYKNRKKK